MGTTFRILLYAPNATIASEASSEAFDRVEQLEQIFSDYREDSELREVCRKASQSPQRLSPDLYFILQSSLHFSELSDGAFDVTIGPVVKLWREARRRQRLPEAEQLSKARLAVGYRNVALDPEDHSVFLKRDDMSLDLGAIAKGYAADQARVALQKYGIHSALVAAGGDLSLGDPPPGAAGWDVQIRSWTSDSVAENNTFQLHNCSTSTSGDKFQFLEAKGKRYSHIIDPNTALGLTDSVSTTVIAPDGTTADALATTLSILPVPTGLALADSLEEVSAFLVRRHGTEFQTFSSRKFPAFSSKSTLHAGRVPHNAGSP
jgi:thiamine biosynthesis lipoprotein